MLRRSLAVAIAVVLCCWSEQKGSAAAPQHHTGTVVSASTGKIVIKNETGKEQTFQVESTAKIMINGKPARLEDFEPTMPVQVTTDEKDKVLAVSTIDQHKGRAERKFTAQQEAGLTVRAS